MLKILFLVLFSQIHLHYTTLDKDTFNTGTFQLIQGGDTISLNMKVRHRGRSALHYDKPSYAIKLTDSIGQNIDTAILGMRSDNYWILDAMAVDHARMRNRVSMDLWLEFSRQPWYYANEPKLINGYRGQMVEVYVNNASQGIYCLMERVDRKQLKLKKYAEKKGIRGLLYKSNHWGGTATFDLPSDLPNSSASAWDSWEIQYPKLEDGEPVSWDPLINLIDFIQSSDSATFADSIAYYVDLPVFTDYILFCQLLSARDNTAKNTLISFYDFQKDQRALYTPWDLDHSWGRQYNGNVEDFDYDLFTQNQLYVRMQKDYPNFKDSLSTRWQELRTTSFSIEHIDSLFATYLDLYTTLGIDTIEQTLWSGHNAISFTIEDERSYIHDWVINRLTFLDTLYSLPTPPITTFLPIEKTGCSAHKILMDGHLYIILNQHKFNSYGQTIYHE